MRGIKAGNKFFNCEGIHISGRYVYRYQYNWQRRRF